MAKKMFFKSASYVAAAFAVAVPLSCVNEAYDMEKLDTTVAFGGDALVFPLGSTKQMTLESLLTGEDFEALETLGDGTYGFTMKGSIGGEGDESGGIQIPDFSDQIKVPDVTFNQGFDLTLSGVDMSNMTFASQSFENPITFDASLPNVNIPSTQLSHTIATGIYDYYPHEDENGNNPLEMDFEGGNLVFGGLLNPSQFNAPLPGDISLPAGTIPDVAVGTSSSSVNVDVQLELNENLKSVEDVVLADNAQMTITVSLQHNFLKSGSVVPDIDLDLSQIIELENNTTGKINLGSDFTLDAANGYSATQSFPISGLAMDDAQWENGFMAKHASITVAEDGRISFPDDITTDSDYINASVQGGGLGVNVNVAFSNMTVTDMTLNLAAPITVNMGENEASDFDLDLPEIVLPDNVAGISTVNMKDGSCIRLSISGSNLDKLTELTIEKNDLVITFPEEIVSSDLDDSNQLVIKAFDPKSSVERTVYVSAIVPPDASINASEQRVIDLSSLQVSVDGYFSADGSLKLSQMPKVEAEDPKIDVQVETVMNIEDYSVELTNAIEHSIAQTENIDFSLPDDIGDLGHFTVTPEGTPTLQVNVTMPQNLESVDFVADDLSITFPEMMVIDEGKAIEDGYVFRNNTITFDGVSVPDNFTLYIETLNINPQAIKDAGGNVTGYHTSGDLTFDGTVRMTSLNQDGSILSTDIETLLNSGINISASVSQITVKEVSFNRFEQTVTEEQTMTLFDFADITNEDVTIESIDEIRLADANLNMSISAVNLPDFGTNHPVQMEIKITLPEEIVLGQTKEVSVVDNVLSISGTLDQDGRFTMPSVPIESIKLDPEFFATDQTQYQVTVKVDGTVYVENPAVEPAELSGQTITVSIDGGIPDIQITEVTGVVDYSIEQNQEIALEGLPEFLKGDDVSLDFANPYITLDVTSNLGLGIEGELVITPYVGADPGAVISIQGFNIPATSGHSESRTTKYYVAASSENMPAGYTFLEAAHLPDMLKKLPDKIEINVVAKTSDDQAKIEIYDPEVAGGKVDYNVALDYEVVVPFVFGDEFKIGMDVTMEDMPAVLGDVLNMTAIGLGGEIVSAVPLNLVLTFELLDSEDNVIETVPTSLNVAAGTLDEPETSPIDVTLKLAEGADAKGFSKIKLNFEANSYGKPGEPVTKDSYIQAVLKVKVPGGITIDLSELGESENTDEN